MPEYVLMFCPENMVISPTMFHTVAKNGRMDRIRKAYEQSFIVRSLSHLIFTTPYGWEGSNSIIVFPMPGN